MFVSHGINLALILNIWSGGGWVISKQETSLAQNTLSGSCFPRELVLPLSPSRACLSCQGMQSTLSSLFSTPGIRFKSGQACLAGAFVQRPDTRL